MIDYSTDILIIKKESRVWDAEELLYKYQWPLCQYNQKTDSYDFTGVIDFDYSDDFEFNGEEPRIIANFVEKLKYVYATMHNDDEVIKVVADIIPGVYEVKIPSKRYTNDYYLKEWMEKYNFTLKEFLTDDKYMVMSDNEYHHMFEHCIELGLIDLGAIDKCSVFED